MPANSVFVTTVILATLAVAPLSFAAEPPVSKTLSGRLASAKHVGLVNYRDSGFYSLYIYDAKQFEQNRARNDMGRIMSFYTVVLVGDDYLELSSADREGANVLIALQYIRNVYLHTKVE